MKNLQHYFQYFALAFSGLLIMSGLATAQMPAPSGDQTTVVPYYCPVSAPVLDDNPLLSKPLSIGPLAAGESTLAPVVSFDFADPVDIYVAISAYSDPTDLWILGPDGRFSLLAAENLVPWASGVWSIEKSLLSTPVAAQVLPIDTYYLYIATTPWGETLGSQGTPFYLWQTSFTVLPPYLSIQPSCLQMESTVGVEKTQLVTISDPDDSKSYTISSVTAGGEGFTIENNNCGDMRGGSNCSFTISFNPSSEGVHNVELSIGIDGFQSGSDGQQGVVSAPPFSITIPVVGVATQAAVSCEPTFSSPNLAFNSLSQTASISVSYPAGCSNSWTASTDVSWITISQGSGTGSGTVTFSLRANTGTSDRSGTIIVAGKTFAVTQSAAAGTCTYSISPATSSISAGGGTGTFQLTTQSGCEWLANGSLMSTWLSVTSSRSGTGSASIFYSVDANQSSSARTGYLTVEGKIFTVTQAGLNCLYSLTPSSATVASGGSGSFTITASSSLCGQPSVMPTDSWIHVSGITSVTGGYEVSYTTDANSGSAVRTSSITVNGTLNFTVTESTSVPACTYTLSPLSQSFSAAGGTGSFTVTVNGLGCSWTAVSSFNAWYWLTVSPTSTQTGGGTVTYSVAANGVGGPRSGSISVGNQSFIISQEGSM